MKQLEVTQLNPKDAKDHLPLDPTAEAQAISDYQAAGIHLHAAGAIYFPKDEDEDIRAKFEYCKRAGVNVIVAGDPLPADRFYELGLVNSLSEPGGAVESALELAGRVAGNGPLALAASKRQRSCTPASRAACVARSTDG